MKVSNVRVPIGAGIAAAASILVSVLAMAVFSLPISWLWNVALVPTFRMSPMGYWRAFGLLSLAYLVRNAVTGFTLSLKLRNLPPPPRVRPYRATGLSEWEP